MLRVGVVADTHSRKIPKTLLKDFQSVDLIIHAGDFCDISDFEVFSNLKEVKAVHGNMDSPAIRKLFARRQILKLGAFSVGLFHGEGPPKTILEKVKEEFKNDKLDLVIFGHSHQPCHQKEGSVLYFNPGSPNDPVFAPYFSYGIIEIGDKDFSAKLIKIKE